MKKLEIDIRKEAIAIRDAAGVFKRYGHAYSVVIGDDYFEHRSLKEIKTAVRHHVYRTQGISRGIVFVIDEV